MVLICILFNNYKVLKVKWINFNLRYYDSKVLNFICIYFLFIYYMDFFFILYFIKDWISLDKFFMFENICNLIIGLLNV